MVRQALVRQAGAEKQDLLNMLLLLLSFSLSLASAQRLTDAEELAFKDNVEDLCRGRYENLLAGKIHKRATLFEPIYLQTSNTPILVETIICRPPTEYFRLTTVGDCRDVVRCDR